MKPGAEDHGFVAAVAVTVGTEDRLNTVERVTGIVPPDEATITSGADESVTVPELSDVALLKVIVPDVMVVAVLITVQLELGVTTPDEICTTFAVLSRLTATPYDEVTGPNPADDMTGKRACTTPDDALIIVRFEESVTVPLDSERTRYPDDAVSTVGFPLICTSPDDALRTVTVPEMRMGPDEIVLTCVLGFVIVTAVEGFVTLTLSPPDVVTVANALELTGSAMT